MKQRENHRWIKERKDSKGRLLCLIPTCKNLREKYKNGNFRNYCKKHTFWDMREFTNWQSLRDKVLKRDNYTCVKCNDSKKIVEVIVKYKKCTNLLERLKTLNGKLEYEWAEREVVKNNLIVDHIKPIALGGDEWDLNNLQTLCLKCNKIKTAQDIKNIAKQRRIEKKQLKNKQLKIKG